MMNPIETGTMSQRTEMAVAAAVNRPRSQVDGATFEMQSSDFLPLKIDNLAYPAYNSVSCLF
jgi:hypothetical protein